MKVWTLLINNRHGTYVSLYHQCKNAETELREYVAEHWGDCLTQEYGALDTLDPDEAVRIYFEDSYDEWYELDEALVMDAEE